MKLRVCLLIFMFCVLIAACARQPVVVKPAAFDSSRAAASQVQSIQAERDIFGVVTVMIVYDNPNNVATDTISVSVNAYDPHRFERNHLINFVIQTDKGFLTTSKMLVYGTFPVDQLTTEEIPADWTDPLGFAKVRMAMDAISQFAIFPVNGPLICKDDLYAGPDGIMGASFYTPNKSGTKFSELTAKWECTAW